MLSRCSRYSAAPAALSLTMLQSSNSLARSAHQFAALPAVSLLASRRRQLSSTCCPSVTHAATPAPVPVAPSSVDLGPVPSFLMSRAIRYSQFSPKLYNWALSMGFTRGKTIPSVAFCSDENQGYPSLVITKHFNTLPFKHAEVGAIVSHNSHGAYASHGQDLVIVLASHVGYDQETQQWGRSTRPLNPKEEESTCCGMIAHRMSWFAAEYQRARLGVKFFKNPESASGVLLQIDNEFADSTRSEGLILDLARMTANVTGRKLSTSILFDASSSLAASLLPLASSAPSNLAHFLTPDLFSFRKSVGDQLSENLFPHMPSILCSPQPMLEAAKVNSVAEFERLYRVVRRQDVFRKRNVLIVAGLNVDLMRGYHPFPGCLFVPWAAYVESPGGDFRVMEQEEVYNSLMQQPDSNSDAVDIDAAIQLNKVSPAVELVVKRD